MAEIDRGRIISPNGTNSCSSVVARSAALALENAELLKRTEELTIMDELTESFNYRYFVQKFQEEKRRAVRYRPAAVHHHD